MAVGVLTGYTMDAVSGIGVGTLTADGTPAACSIFCGFTPRRVEMVQTSGTVGNAAFTSADSTMTTDYCIQTTAAGVTTIVTSNGFKFLTGSEAAPAAKATGSPNSSGPGVTIGTVPQTTASAAYRITIYR